MPSHLHSHVKSQGVLPGPNSPTVLDIKGGIKGFININTSHQLTTEIS